MSSFNVGDRVLVNNVIIDIPVPREKPFRISFPTEEKEEVGTITEVVPMYGGGYKYFLVLDSGVVFSSSDEGFYFDDHSLTKIDNIEFDVSGLEKLI